jgi:hypothetical protein
MWEENPKLGRWVSTQRLLFKSGKLEPERQRRLDEIEFHWSSERGKEAWATRFEQLKAYKEQFGDCNVPEMWEENPQLSNWVKTQRQLLKSERLESERQRRLDEIGFDWGSDRNLEWAKRFEELKAYKEQFGDCNVPKMWEENPKLGRWVSTQRLLFKSGKLEPERQRRLDEIEFHWSSDSKLDSDWAKRFEELKAYKERFGDCRVPVKGQENPQLGGWVAAQRHRLKSGILSPEKSKLLVELGF